MKMTKTIIQFTAVVMGCLVLVFVLAPSNVTGEISDSIIKFVKAFGLFFQAIIFGAFAGNGSGGE